MQNHNQWVIHVLATVHVNKKFTLGFHRTTILWAPVVWKTGRSTNESRSAGSIISIRSMPFHFVSLHSIPFHSIPIHFIPFRSFLHMSPQGEPGVGGGKRSSRMALQAALQAQQQQSHKLHIELGKLMGGVCEVCCTCMYMYMYVYIMVLDACAVFRV